MDRRLPPRHVSGGLFNWAIFKSAAFTTYTAGVLSFSWGCIPVRMTDNCQPWFGIVYLLMIMHIGSVLTYIDASGPSQGISDDLSFYLVPIANAAGGFGRYSAVRRGSLWLDKPSHIIICTVLNFTSLRSAQCHVAVHSSCRNYVVYMAICTWRRTRPYCCFDLRVSA